MNRYFLVFYLCTIHSGPVPVELKGMTDAITHDGKYLSLKLLTMQITDMHNAQPNRKCTNVVVTNIIELTESDYKDFTNEDISERIKK